MMSDAGCFLASMVSFAANLVSVLAIPQCCYSRLQALSLDAEDLLKYKAVSFQSYPYS